jgi:hypothetical protein
MNDAASAKLKMLNASTGCLVFGLLALLPVIGLPFGVTALWFAGRVRVLEKQHWNAAAHYCLIGGTCAALGTIFWTIVLIIIVFRAIMAAQGLN